MNSTDEPTQEIVMPLCEVAFPGLGSSGMGIRCTKLAGHDDVEHECNNFEITRFVPVESTTSYRVRWEITDHIEGISSATG